MRNIFVYIEVQILANRKMEENESELKLIELTHEHPCLWNKRHPKYKNSLAKEKAWETIAKELKLSAGECSKIWKTIRAQFFAHRRKLKQPSGSSSGNRPYFRHESQMQFLLDVEESERSISNVIDNEIDEENELEVRDIEPSQVDVNSTTPVSRSSDTSTHSSVKKRKIDPVEAEMLQLLKADVEDEFAVVGRLVASKLRRIHSADRKLYYETENFIMTILHDADLKLCE